MRRAGSLWHKSAGGATPRNSPRHRGGPHCLSELAMQGRRFFIDLTPGDLSICPLLSPPPPPAEPAEKMIKRSGERKLSGGTMPACSDYFTTSLRLRVKKTFKTYILLQFYVFGKSNIIVCFLFIIL